MGPIKGRQTMLDEFKGDFYVYDPERYDKNVAEARDKRRRYLPFYFLFYFGLYVYVTCQ